jgi:hypothetical protein
VSLAEPNDKNRLTHVTLKMDNPTDQWKLVELMARGNARSVRSQESSVEDVFIEGSGFR